jgi:hypothetical protein
MNFFICLKRLLLLLSNDNTITITSSNFINPYYTVVFNGIEISTTYISPTSLSFNTTSTVQGVLYIKDINYNKKAKVVKSGLLLFYRLYMFVF